jgi:hypothetical protein
LTIEDEELKTTQIMYTCLELEFDDILGIDACRELDYVGQRGQTGRIEKRIKDLEKFLTKKKGINDRTEDDCVKRTGKEGAWKRYKSKKLSREEKEALDDYLTEMMEKEFIKRLNTPTSSNIIMVRKPDNTFRVCVWTTATSRVTRWTTFTLCPMIVQFYRECRDTKSTA